MPSSGKHLSVFLLLSSSIVTLQASRCSSRQCPAGYFNKQSFLCQRCASSLFDFISAIGWNLLIVAIPENIYRRIFENSFLNKALGHQLRKMFKWSVVRLFRLFRKTTSGQCPAFQVIRQTIATYAFSAARIIGAITSVQINLFLTFHFLFPSQNVLGENPDYVSTGLLFLDFTIGNTPLRMERISSMV